MKFDSEHSLPLTFIIASLLKATNTDLKNEIGKLEQEIGKVDQQKQLANPQDNKELWICEEFERLHSALFVGMEQIRNQCTREQELEANSYHSILDKVQSAINQTQAEVHQLQTTHQGQVEQDRNMLCLRVPLSQEW